MDSYDGYTIRFGPRSMDFFELSPYYYCTFQIGNRKYRTLIHYWYSSYFKDDIQMMDTIRNLDTPEKVMLICKRYGLNSLEQIEPKVIIAGIQARIEQNPGIKDVLLCTGNSYLNYMDDKSYLGQENRYGRLLMKIRDIYSTGKV